MVFVTGEAGSGKTALLGEFARQAMQAHADLVVAGGNCNAIAGIGDPYLPFREILQLLSGDIEAKRAGGSPDTRACPPLVGCFAGYDYGAGWRPALTCIDTFVPRARSGPARRSLCGTGGEGGVAEPAQPVAAATG